MLEEMLKQPPVDVPEVLFGGLKGRTVHAKIVCTQSGVIAGMDELDRSARALGLRAAVYSASGSWVIPGSIVAVVVGQPAQIVHGEDVLLGIISKVSGVATAAHAAVCRAGRLKVVCGGWKKMPAAMKQDLRNALRAGGLESRIASGPFLYLDKNYVRIFGSIGAALETAARLPDRTVCIQVRGETAPIVEESITAARGGAQVLIVDTGRIQDLREVSGGLRSLDLRSQVSLAFAGGVSLSDLEGLQNEDVDIVDIGRSILDAPLLDFRYDVFDARVSDSGGPSYLPMTYL